MSFYRKANIRIIAFCLLIACVSAPILPLTGSASADSVTAMFRIEQIFTKNSSVSDADGVFFYTLIALDDGNPMPEGSIRGRYAFTIEGTRIINADPITFTNTGIYRYELSTNPDFAPTGYICDDQIYTITVYVSRPVEDLKTEIIVQKSSGRKTGSISFENSYTPLASDRALMVDPPVKKTVSGNPSTPGTFVFALTAGNPSNPMPEGSINGVKTMVIVGTGEKDFGTWEYTREGTYYYTISEVNTGEARYTYDDTIYTITDVVRDVNGQLELSRTVTNDAVKQVRTCTYINKYDETLGERYGTGDTSGSTSGSTSGGTNGSTSGSTNGSTSGGVAARGPKTGDDTMSELYTFLLWAGIAVIVGCVVFLIIAGKRKREETEERAWQ
ncbi:MAG: hypothetical protein LBD85_03560 [Oscillospiraceae bacterium]|jgi:pilin isopeptide linkage protein|nr:hypothetical protein [Oscillospiraceae bacterium]